MKKAYILLISLIIALLAACSGSAPTPTVSLSPSPSAIISASPSQSLPVREENTKIQSEAKEAYNNGANYWSSVKTNIQPLNKNCVYWTPNGKSYHSTKDCVALLNSTQIISGTLKQAIAAGKTDPCSKCVGH